MAVEWVRPIRSRQWAGKERNQTEGRKQWLVLCSDRTNDGPDVAAAVCAVVGAVYSLQQPGLQCTGVDAQERDEAPRGGGTLYEVTADFSTSPGSEFEQQAEDPRERPLVIRLGFDRADETIYQWQEAPTAEDADGTAVAITWPHGKALVNSARQPFPEGLTETFEDPIVTVSKAVDTAEFPQVWALLEAYAGTLNAHDLRLVYRGRPYVIKAKTGKLTGPASEPRVERLTSTGEEVQYEDLSFSWHVRKDGWDRRILDQGTLEAGGPENDPSYNNPRPVADERGDAVTEPTLLNGKGKKLGGGKPVFLKGRTKVLGDHRQLLALLNR